MRACHIQYVLLLSLLGFFPCSGEDVEEQLAIIIECQSALHFIQCPLMDWRRKELQTWKEETMYVQRPEKNLVSGHT